MVANSRRNATKTRATAQGRPTTVAEREADAAAEHEQQPATQGVGAVGTGTGREEGGQGREGQTEQQCAADDVAESVSLVGQLLMSLWCHLASRILSTDAGPKRSCSQRVTGPPSRASQ